MNIVKIYVGGWFHRTTLHLSEIYDFLREGTSPLKLDAKKLKKLHEALQISELYYEMDGLEYVRVCSDLNVRMKISEDGLVLLGSIHEKESEMLLKDHFERLERFYEDRLSPMTNYLFSLGSPMPKELLKVKAIYPFFIVTKGAKKEDILARMEKLGEAEYYEIKNENFDIYRGNQTYFINMKKEKLESVERFIEEQIFLREFKAGMHHYLNLHRVIWDKIDQVAHGGRIKGKELDGISGRMERVAKTVNLAGSRIAQKGSYLSTREKIALHDARLKDFEGILEFRYATLQNSLNYIKELWSMTEKELSTAQKAVSNLQGNIANKSLSSLTVVTSMGVGAQLIGLFTKDKAPEFTWFGVFYFLILVALGWTVSKLIAWMYGRKTYKIEMPVHESKIE